ncbi:6440_t:CDS:1, partial [Acaulospora morrowiae]
ESESESELESKIGSATFPNRNRASEHLGIPYTTLYMYIKNWPAIQTELVRMLGSSKLTKSLT